MELLSARGIEKYFRDTQVRANRGVSLSLQEGETRAVVGENGAGKSTLARIIAGLLAPDSGELLARGKRLRGGSVREAERAGIGFVPQTSLLAEGLSVAENIVLGREPRTMGLFVSRRRAYVDSALLIERFGFSLDPDAAVSSLSAAESRQAEIARALARGGEVLILDEPTSILSEAEAKGLFDLLARLAGAGKAILLVTHRLPEVLAVADSITVMREGAVVAELGQAELNAPGWGEELLSSLMARPPRQASDRAGADALPLPLGPESSGTSPEDGAAASEGYAARQASRSSAPAFELRGLRLAPGAQPLDLSLRPGEILGVTALAGNGLKRLEDYASGMLRPDEGSISIGGAEIGSLPREDLRSRLLGYAPSDRESRGLCLPASARDNLLALRGREFAARDWLGKARRDRAAREAALLLGLDAAPGRRAASLSGGNRQRLLLARELDRPRAVLVLAEPFQGLDLASQEEVAEILRRRAEGGSAVLLLVSAVDEALRVADRVMALYRGEVAFEGPNEGKATGRRLLNAMTGGAAPGRPAGGSAA
jgi:general nucleoside transport system ATP-binding protein